MGRRQHGRSSSCVPIQGQHPKDVAFAATPCDRPLSTIVKWDGLAFRLFPGYVTRFSYSYLYVTISATQAYEREVKE